jgi:hypothetical protein
VFKKGGLEGVPTDYQNKASRPSSYQSELQLAAAKGGKQPLVFRDKPLEVSRTASAAAVVLPTTPAALKRKPEGDPRSCRGPVRRFLLSGHQHATLAEHRSTVTLRLRTCRCSSCKEAGPGGS